MATRKATVGRRARTRTRDWATISTPVDRTRAGEEASDDRKPSDLIAAFRTQLHELQRENAEFKAREKARQYSPGSVPEEEDRVRQKRVQMLQHRAQEKVEQEQQIQSLTLALVNTKKELRKERLEKQALVERQKKEAEKKQQISDRMSRRRDRQQQRQQLHVRNVAVKPNDQVEAVQPSRDVGMRTLNAKWPCMMLKAPLQDDKNAEVAVVEEVAEVEADVEEIAVVAEVADIEADVEEIAVVADVEEIAEAKEIAKAKEVAEVEKVAEVSEAAFEKLAVTDSQKDDYQKDHDNQNDQSENDPQQRPVETTSLCSHKEQVMPGHPRQKEKEPDAADPVESSF